MRSHKFNGSRVIYFTTGLLILSLLLSLALVLLTNTKSKAQNSDYIYASIRIEEGDTLSGLASTYLNSSGMTNHSDFMREISRVNRLSSDTIFSGAYLIIPMKQ